MGNAGSGGAQPSPAVGAAADYDEAYRHLSQLQLDGDENQQPGTHTATAAPMVSGSCAPLAPAQPFGNGQQHMTVAQALDALHATPPTARQPLRFRDCPAGTVDLSQTYEVREQLGRGAVDGVVVRFAHHRATGEPVAIKCAPAPNRPAPPLVPELTVRALLAPTAPNRPAPPLVPELTVRALLAQGDSQEGPQDGAAARNNVAGA